MHARAGEHNRDHKFQSPEERQLAALQILAFSDSPSFVAVMQPTDLRYGRDGPHFRRLNRSWLGRVLPQ